MAEEETDTTGILLTTSFVPSTLHARFHLAVGHSAVHATTLEVGKLGLVEAIYIAQIHPRGK